MVMARRCTILTPQMVIMLRLLRNRRYVVGQRPCDFMQGKLSDGSAFSLMLATTPARRRLQQHLTGAVMARGREHPEQVLVPDRRLAPRTLPDRNVANRPRARRLRFPRSTLR